MKKWLVVEAVILTSVPIVILLYSVPFIWLGTVFIFHPFYGDSRVWYERMFGILPYLGGALALWAIWSYVVELSNGRIFRLDWKLFVSVFGGFLASWELTRTTNLPSVIIIVVPPWILAGHLLYIRHYSAER